MARNTEIDTGKGTVLEPLSYLSSVTAIANQISIDISS